MNDGTFLLFYTEQMSVVDHINDAILRPNSDMSITASMG